MIENKTLIFHIGMMKTASTYLQYFIFPQFKDVFYTGIWNDTKNPLNDFVDRIKTYNLSKEEFKKFEEKISSYINNIKQDKIILSDEGLIGTVDYNFINQMNIFNSLKKMFKNIKIIFVLREQSSFIESYYVQTLHEYDSYSIEHVINYRKNEFKNYQLYSSYGRNMDIKSINYFYFYNTLEEYFGKDNILILPFEMMKQERELYIKKICEFCGEDFNRIEIKDILINRSYSSFSCKIARLLNRFIAKPKNNCGFIPEKPFCEKLKKYKGNNKFIFLLRKISCGLVLGNILQNYVDKYLPYNKPKYLSSDMKEKIKKYHSSYNKKLDEILNIDLGKYGYYK